METSMLVRLKINFLALIIRIKAEIWQNIFSMAAILDFKMADTYYVVNFGIIRFLNLENMGIAVQIKSLSLLRAEIWPKLFNVSAILE